MMDKYRVHEVAKDLNAPSKEMVDLLAKVDETPKKHMTALTEEELNFVFETYTQKNQVTSFDEYFKEGEENKKKMAEQKAAAPVKPAEAAKPTPAPEKPAEAVKPAPAQAKSAEAVKPAPAQAKPAEAVKPAPAQAKPAEAVKPAPVQTNAPAQDPRTTPTATYRTPRPQQTNTQAPDPRSTPTATYRTPRPQGQGYQGNQPRTDAPRPQYNNQNQNRPQGQGGYQGNQPRTDAPRPQYNNNNQARPQGQTGTTGAQVPRTPFNQSRPPQQPRTASTQPKPQHNQQQARPAYNNAPKPVSAPQSSENAQAVIGEKGVRHVDMRAVTVNLDKYNERYEQIAPVQSTRKDTEVKKQKLTQRSSYQKGKPIKSRKEKEDEKLRRLELERQRRQKLEVTLPEEIVVSELAAKLKIQSAEIIKRLMMMGVMASATEVIDYDTAALVAIEIGAKVEREVVVTIEDRLFVDAEEDTENLQPRSPIVVVMGHVDHGKTSLLDAIRKTKVTTGEAGGITQHIGAYQVMVNNKPITFLDTPGHAAFTSMRARGAQVTDIAILVVAADDGIMPQTIEAINHAKAAGVAIIVAINKMDKPAANIEKVKQELTEHELVPEEWGGDIVCVPVSAKTGENLDTLLEMIQIVADVQELKANPDRLAKGTVIEAKLDKGRGPVATLLVQTGTLRTGDAIIAGTSLGRVRVMNDDRGNRVDEAGPSMPVEITGLAEVPSAGDIFNAVGDERLAKELVSQRRHEAKEELFSAYQKVTLDNLFAQISEGEMKELAIIVKGDVQGSVEAVKQSLEKLTNEEVRVKVIHDAVGAVSESDVMLASASNAIIIGFNVRHDPIAKETAERDGVEIRLYRIIYDAIEDVKTAMKGMLDPKYRDVDLGRAEVRAVYKITNVGTVAGCYVVDGKIARNANIRVVRDGIVIADDKLDSLRRFKEDVKEVAQGYECGMGLTKFNDIKEGDVFEAYIIEEYRD